MAVVGVPRAPLRAQDVELPLFVGQTVCGECHGDASGRACPSPRIAEHDQSFHALLRPQARSIAALNGIHRPPTQTRLCLECHAAGAEEGPRWWTSTFQLSDGVQCEACHGAGSLHARGEDEAGRRRPMRNPPLACEICHDDRPSHRSVLDEGFALTPADEAYKTPVNLTLSADGRQLFVVCEHSDSVIVVELATRAVIREIPVGRRPFAAALSPDGERLYVTSRMDGLLTAIDLRDWQVIGRVAVGSDLHGAAVTPSGRHVLVADTSRNQIAVVDVASMSVVRRLTAGTAPWAITLGPNGKSAWVTSARPSPAAFREPHHSEITIVDTQSLTVSARRNVADANMLHGIAPARTDGAALITLMRTKNLVPATRMAQGWMMTNGLGVAWPDGQVDQVLLDDAGAHFPDPMDVAVSPDGRLALVTSGGADEVAVVDVPALLNTIQSSPLAERVNDLPNRLGTKSRFVLQAIKVGRNPRGVIFSADGRYAYVANALDDSVSIIDTATMTALEPLSLGGPQTISELRHGEQLFHSAEITYARQFTCRSCHPDGHLNGLTFDIEADGIGRSPVDNRTLQGIFDTAPFKWEGINPTLHRQCGPRLAVFFTRLAPYDRTQLNALVRYMCTIEAPPNPYRAPDGLTVAQRRGKLLFERTAMNNGAPLGREQSCVGCHSGAHRTSRKMSEVGSTMWFDAPAGVEPREMSLADEYGELGVYFFVDAGLPTRGFDVAHLRNIYGSPPYLHNGSAASLEEIWTRFNMVNRHGVTADLTREQWNDLMAYLRAQ